MDQFEQAFRLLPDTIIITDIYWYILACNRQGPFEGLKKGKNLSGYMPDCKEMPCGVYQCHGRVFKRRISRVFADGVLGGYVIYLVDITEMEQLVGQRRRKNTELEELTRKQAKANAELEAYARQAEALTDYEEQLRIARAIHDETGHAITDLNTLSRMCLQLRESDTERYFSLIEEGVALCRKAEEGETPYRCRPLRQMLERFRDTSPFHIDLVITGEEPPFAEGLHDVILGVCKEAYHNTLSHSLADRLMIEVHMTEEKLTLEIADNGNFHGALNKGFGLRMMEENVGASGGRVRFEAEEGRGFRVAAEWRGAA